jgi:glycosyltransferase involved in cell wall biosynthesis
MEDAALGARAGGDTHIIEISRKGDSLGHTVVMLTSASGKLLLDVEGTRLKHHQISVPFENFLVKSILGVGVLYTLRPFVAIFTRLKGRFDVIVTSSHYPSDVLSAFFLHLRNPKSKIVVYFHGISVPSKHGIFLRSLSTVFNYFGTLLTKKFGDLIFVINKPTKNFLLCLGVKDEKIVLTWNGVRMPVINLPLGIKSFDACFLGRFTKSKGVFDLVQIWKKVGETKNRAKLVIIGDGPERQHANELVLKEGLKNNLTLPGFLSGERKYELLQSSRVFVFPSYQESWGIAVAEAMVCGLPVVAYSLPVYKEVFEDKLVTVPLGDVDSMAKQVIFLLENPEVARKIGEEGREFVKKYDWNHVAEQELSAIIDLVNER